MYMVAPFGLKNLMSVFFFLLQDFARFVFVYIIVVVTVQIYNPCVSASNYIAPFLCIPLLTFVLKKQCLKWRNISF